MAPLPSEVLAKAADLIEPEGAWTQFVAASDAPIFNKDDVPTDEDGDEIEMDERAPEACCWCATGAIWRSAPGGLNVSPGDVRAIAAGYAKRVVCDNVPDWNDAPGRTQAEVVAALRAASEIARSEGQ